MRFKRKNVAKEYDRVLIRQLTAYISELSSIYDLHVAIGRLKYIRNIALWALIGTQDVLYYILSMTIVNLMVATLGFTIASRAQGIKTAR